MAKETFQETKESDLNPSPESGSLESNVFGVTEPIYGEVEQAREKLPRRIWNGFKRDPNLRATPKGVVGANGKVYDVEAAVQATAESPLARKLKGRHLQMIAIGGSIGMFLQSPVIERILRLDQAPVFSSLQENLCQTVARRPF